MEKILLIDDEAVIRATVGEALKQRGYVVLEANNGRTGLNSALLNLPNLIVLDVLMPEKNGLEMLTELRQSSDWGKKVPVIIFSQSDVNAEIKMESDHGYPTKYLMKSKTGLNELLDEVKNTLAKP